VPIFCFVPGLLAAALTFLAHNITARLINKPDNKLRKGPGYHLDLLVLAAINAVCSLLGLPWVCAATVRSINHLYALAKKEEVVTNEGFVHEHIVRVRETRLASLLIHALVGASLFVAAALREVPMSVLFGVFLTMGISSLFTNQFWERIQLLVMQPSLYPPTSYVRQVSRLKLHAFTFLQLVCLGALWGVKESICGVGFPAVVCCLVPLRLYLLPRAFSKRELRFLDTDEDIDTEEVRDEDQM